MTKALMDREQWNHIISQFEGSTILQTWEWGKIKSKYGWKQDYYVKEDAFGNLEAAALILSREQRLSKFGPSMKILYVPHGPLLDWGNPEFVIETLDHLKEYSKKQKAAYIKIDPQIVLTQDTDNSMQE